MDMDGSFKVARLLGFDINVHWSWIFIFLLITWTFSVGILQEFFPEWAAATRWAAAAFVALIFFLSILFHELSHSIMARRFGISVSGITLFVFGGVSNLGKESETPKQEFLIAVVGPLTSLAFAAVFAAGYFVLWPVAEGIGAVSLNLAVINLAIAVFNMVPGYPLDGGRVLRSVLWARSKSQFEATKSASQVGMWVAYGIMGLGVLSFFFLNPISGLWLFLIGNFLRMAADASYRQVVVQSMLQGVPARTMARGDVIGVPPETTIADLVEDHILVGHGRAFPVTNNGSMLGLITLTDAQRVPRDKWSTTRVSQAMTPRRDVKSVKPEQDLAEVLEIMGTGDINQVPIVDDGHVEGMIYRGDVIRYVQTRQDVEASAAIAKERKDRETVSR
jgi:Zn-dependent protease/CBS domain-containing protein